MQHLQIQELAEGSFGGDRLAAAKRIDKLRAELGKKRNKKGGGHLVGAVSCRVRDVEE